MTDDHISVIKVRSVLLVTMPADPDDGTIAAMQAHVLQATAQYETTGVVLDLTAVDTLDSFFARTVAETAQMVALLGGRTVITGMRPSVAITVTQLGLTLGSALTALTVDRALDVLANSPEWR